MLSPHNNYIKLNCAALVSLSTSYMMTNLVVNNTAIFREIFMQYLQNDQWNKIIFTSTSTAYCLYYFSSWMIFRKGFYMYKDFDRSSQGGFSFPRKLIANRILNITIELCLPRDFVKKKPFKTAFRQYAQIFQCGPVYRSYCLIYKHVKTKSTVNKLINVYKSVLYNK